MNKKSSQISFQHKSKSNKPRRSVRRQLNNSDFKLKRRRKRKRRLKKQNNKQPRKQKLRNQL